MSATAIPCACVPNVKKGSQRKKCSPIAGGVRMENSKVRLRKSQIMNPSINNSSVKCLRNCRKFTDIYIAHTKIPS